MAALWMMSGLLILAFFVAVIVLIILFALSLPD